MTITNKEFSNILSLVIQELVFLEQQEKQDENYYQEMTELKRKLLIINGVKKGWVKWEWEIMVTKLKLRKDHIV